MLLELGRIWSITINVWDGFFSINKICPRMLQSQAAIHDWWGFERQVPILELLLIRSVSDLTCEHPELETFFLIKQLSPCADTGTYNTHTCIYMYMPSVTYLPIYSPINTWLYLLSLSFNFQVLLIFNGQTVRFICIDVDLVLVKVQTNFSLHGIWHLINFVTGNVWGSDLWPDRTLALALATSQLWSGLYTLCFLICKVLWIMTCFNEHCII